MVDYKHIRTLVDILSSKLDEDTVTKIKDEFCQRVNIYTSPPNLSTHSQIYKEYSPDWDYEQHPVLLDVQPPACGKTTMFVRCIGNMISNHIITKALSLTYRIRISAKQETELAKLGFIL